MFALLALVCFVLVTFHVHVPIDLLALGLAFVAAHLLLGAWPVNGISLRRD
jgi:hypothetical protein